MKIMYIGPYPLVQAKQGDAGYDIATNEDRVIYGKTSAQFSTGLHMAIPPGYVGKVVSRSGLSFKYGIEVGAGVIDSGYRGEIKIHLHNNGNSKVEFKKGDRIAQIIIQKHESPEFVLVESLDETERGTNGFGHTGINNDHPFYRTAAHMATGFIPADVWDNHPDYPRDDWQHEVRNGDTNLGYWDWLEHKRETEIDNLRSGLEA